MFEPWYKRKLHLSVEGEEGTEGGGGEGEGGEGGDGEPAQPKYVDEATFNKSMESVQKLEGLLAGVSENLSRLQGGFEALATRGGNGGALPKEAAKPPVTKEDLEKVLAEGQGVDKLLTMVEYMTDSKIEALRRSSLDPLQAQGVSAISELASSMVKEKSPHLKKYEKEYDEWISKLPAEARMNPKSYKMAEQFVLGMHFDEILQEVLAGEKEKMLRGQAGGGAGGMGGGSGRGAGAGGGGSIPTVEELCGRDSALALEEKGMSADDFAKKLGYKGGWAEYAALAKEEVGSGKK